MFYLYGTILDLGYSREKKARICKLIVLPGDLKPVELIENTVCIGRVTHVTSPESVWIQICRGVANTDYLTQLGNLTDTLTQTLGRYYFYFSSEKCHYC